MNRLILIGNGFDLAHGLKTRYNDFIFYYLKKCYRSALEATNENKRAFTKPLLYSDKLLSIKTEHAYSALPSIENIVLSPSINDLLSGQNNALRLVNLSNFAKDLIDNCIGKNWVDIELLYYNYLRDLLSEYNRHGNNKSLVLNGVRNLNAEFEVIKSELEDYLSTIQSATIDQYHKIFYDDLEPFVSADLPEIKFDSSVLVLNFNYTNIPFQYLKERNSIINIQGELKKDDNPIVFGYGDEIDEAYKDMENINKNDFFKYIKSFDYLKTSNYNNLLRFIESNNFEVFILGHSCGLSDRTLLNTIFENKYCQRIKIFYYSKEDYRDKTYEISRHFKDKASMRKKILPLPKCLPMPQLPEQPTNIPNKPETV